MTTHRPAALGLSVVLALAAGAAPTGALARTDVPIRQLVLPNGDTRYSVPVTVGGGPPIEAQLDTGSFGLRVLHAALTPDRYAPTDLRRRYAFGSGAVLDGHLARATLAVGGVETDQPILFQVVESVGCGERQPRCPAARLSQQDYKIGGDGHAGLGFDAILGLSLRRAPSDDSALNPLTVTGSRSWIVELPRPGSAEVGHLIVDPDASDRAGFDLVQLQPQAEGGGLQPPGWADFSLQGCFLEAAKKTRVCGRSALDSGAPGFSVTSATAQRPSRWSDGRAASFELDGAGAPKIVRFTTGPDWSTHVVVHPARPSGGAEIVAGTLPFFSYAVLFDAKAGTMGFKPR